MDGTDTDGAQLRSISNIPHAPDHVSVAPQLVHLTRTSSRAPAVKADGPFVELRLCLDETKTHAVLYSTETRRLPTGLAVDVPPDQIGQILPVPELAGDGIAVLNAPLRGPQASCDVVLINHARLSKRLEHGALLGWLWLSAAPRVDFEVHYPEQF